jgi:hypothetical protein
MDWWMDLLTIYTHHLKLQVITALLLISTIHNLLKAKSSPAFSVFHSSSLTTASNRGNSSASRAHVLSSQPPLQNSTLNLQLTTRPPTLNWRPTESKVKVIFRLTVSQSVSLGVELMTRYLLLFNSYGLVFVGCPLWREDGSVFCICCWPLPAQSLSQCCPTYLYIGAHLTDGCGGAGAVWRFQ